MLENEEDEQAMEEVGKLEDKLKEKGLSQEKISEIARYCEDLVELEQKEQFQAQVEVNAK